ncbi:hypothetical protein K450DRAFT_245252 [Umbelopsis ramanniana AG]|uniref:BPL/LPL catalytic domain-containing protein n=1 Tax=Umbelopsis ramanniana AG TaxID=1314678 RepID=A0AAD5HE20_UMBRA|nr:uncharacterized protein K450DRAFT_245252 [Umbelopsis ramanniana AG]KAI8578733.1 hypothetical protein K450DRAFT_245252 [Umbelopsis ramanniana AG]
MNVLVYTGDGTSPNSVSHTVSTLKSLLGHSYDIIKVDAQALDKEPWEATCSMLVMPGGRDLPYCHDLNGPVNARIRHYVSEGGRYWGICAGAYYGCQEIEFEKGRNAMEVIGKRELAFFPGLSRGTMYPGFIYNSERGARATKLSIDRNKLMNLYANNDAVPSEIDTYYNGGGYFVNADQYESVEVLARYTEKGICQDEEYPAAVVHCRVGKGSAILVGTHPEYDVARMKDNFDDYEGTDMIQNLMLADPSRKQFLRALFARVGLNVVGYTKPVQEDAKPQLQENHVPALTPLYLSGFRLSQYEEVVAKLRSTADASFHLRDVNDTFCIKSLPNEPAVDLGTLNLNETDDEPQEKKIKDILVIDKPSIEPVCPPGYLTKYFNIANFYEHLKKHRSQQWGGGGWFSYGNTMLYGEVVTSTQTMLDKNFKFSQILPSGLVCLATNQVAGRGRGRNAWVSQSGAVQFSMVMHHSITLSNAPVVFIQYLVALAVVESIRTRKGYENVPLRLKWPNDIYAQVQEKSERGEPTTVLKKVGGLLVNSSFLKNEFLLVVGCGINLNNPFPTTSINDVIHAHDASLPKLTPEDTLAGILVTFEEMYNTFCDKGMGSWFLNKYYERWLHSNAIVTLTTHDMEQVKITGITTDYGLLETVSTSNPSKRFTLQPDGNSFDMLKGLIVRKE